MLEYTKGKWEYVEYIPEGITLNGKEYLIMAGGEDVALALRENDARLIAAAPEMYEALYMLFGYVYEAEGVAKNPGYKAKAKKDIAQVEALLARIEGEDVKGGENNA